MSSAKDLESLFHTCMPLFIALGDEVRLSIIEALSRASYGEQTAYNVNDITKMTQLSRPAISHHLKILKDAGIIDMYQSGTSNYYYLTLKDATSQLMDLGHMLQDFID